MKETTLYFSGMHCENCEKTITRALTSVGVTVKSINHKTQQAEVSYDELIPMSRIASAITDAGYELKDQPQNSGGRVPGFLDRLRGIRKAIRENPSAFAHEKRIVLTSLGTLAIVLALEYLLYVALFWNIENFWVRYGQYMIYASIAVVATGAAIRQLRAYRGGVSCMSGMMIGMTIGMMSSMLIGITLGATNGMFVGGVVSMILGMTLGAWVGACCGIMGIMEGMMAGLMGGTMGPMISVMMINDRLNYFLPFFFVAGLLILFGLSYIVFKEHKARASNVVPYGFWSFTFINFAVVAAISLIMVWGPKAAFLTS